MMYTLKPLTDSEIDDKSSHLIEGMTAWSSFIGELLDSDADQKIDYSNCEAILRRGAHDILHELNLRPEFHTALNDATTAKQRDDRSWHWYLLSNTPLMRIGLVTIYRDSPIPPHDHPESYGVQQVLTGKVHVRQYQPADPLDQKYQLVSLNKISDCELVKDRTAMFTPSHMNIHEIESITPRSVLLSILIHPFDPGDRSWFFPMNGADPGATLLYNRIRKHSASGHMADH